MRMHLTAHHKNIALYIAKCVTGFAAISLIGEQFAIPDVTWVVISMLLVLSPDSTEAIPLTTVRIKANLLASLTSVLFLFLCPNVTLAICLSILVTIIACDVFKLMAGSRAALAAVVIVSVHPLGTHLWSTALERIAAVIVGCAVGLLLTFLFHRQLNWRHVISSGNHQSE